MNNRWQLKNGAGGTIILAFLQQTPKKENII
jgi:hypothetical protein